MNLILFGPPGAGKGTQANNIVKNIKLHKVSSGDLLRDEIKNKTDVGIKIKPIIEKGSFVPDDIISNLINNGGLIVPTRADMLSDLDYFLDFLLITQKFLVVSLIFF